MICIDDNPSMAASSPRHLQQRSPRHSPHPWVLPRPWQGLRGDCWVALQLGRGLVEESGGWPVLEMLWLTGGSCQTLHSPRAAQAGPTASP